MDTRLRVGRAIGKTKEEVAHDLMEQLKARGHPETPPAIATDGKGDYRTTLLDLTRSVDTLSLPAQIGQQRWKRQTPAMAAKLTDHIWTIKELLMTVVPPGAVNN